MEGTVFDLCTINFIFMCTFEARNFFNLHTTKTVSLPRSVFFSMMSIEQSIMASYAGKTVIFKTRRHTKQGKIS